MSNTAASGGYWIAAGADRIVAQPAHADRLDRRRRRQAGARGGLAQAGRELGRGRPAATTPTSGRSTSPTRPRRQARVDALVGWLYDRFTELVVRGPRPAAGAGAGDRQGPGLGRRDGAGAGAGRRAGRARRGAWRRCAGRCSCRPTRRSTIADPAARRKIPLRLSLRSLSPIARAASAALLGCSQAALRGTAVSLPVTVR